MTSTTTATAKPFDQSIRIFFLRLSFVVLIPLILLVKPPEGEMIIGEVMEQSGLLLIVAGVLGRFWSTLYIGGHKNKTIMQQGPYSMCRHPLYLFSTLGAIGFGLMLQSVVLTVIVGGLFFTILNMTASREEKFLRAEFGPDYDEYAARTPRIIPNPFGFRTDNDVMFSAAHLRHNLMDALVFLSLIPIAELVEWVRETGVLPAITLI